MTHAQFIKERQYLSNVSPATVEWYKQSLRWLGTESPTADDLKAFVIRMREHGLKPTACNNRIRAVNAYLKWAGSPHRVSKLKEPQCILPTFTTAQVKLMLNWKPRNFYQRRLHLLVLILLDTGCRISEALDVHVSDCDLDNLLLTLAGKGRRQRKVSPLVATSSRLHTRTGLLGFTQEASHTSLPTTSTTWGGNLGVVPAPPLERALRVSLFHVSVPQIQPGDLVEGIQPDRFAERSDGVVQLSDCNVLISENAPCVAGSNPGLTRTASRHASTALSCIPIL